jgi:hypothetical protein
MRTPGLENPDFPHVNPVYNLPREDEFSLKGDTDGGKSQLEIYSLPCAV